MKPRRAAVALEDDGLGIVEEPLARQSAKKRTARTSDRRSDSAVRSKTNSAYRIREYAKYRTKTQRARTPPATLRRPTCPQSICACSPGSRSQTRYAWPLRRTHAAHEALHDAVAAPKPRSRAIAASRVARRPWILLELFANEGRGRARACSPGAPARDDRSRLVPRPARRRRDAPPPGSRPCRAAASRCRRGAESPTPYRAGSSWLHPREAELAKVAEVTQRREAAGTSPALAQRDLDLEVHVPDAKTQRVFQPKR